MDTKIKTYDKCMERITVNKLTLFIVSYWINYQIETLTKEC